jgi:ABC-2 type transport system ATP-binding protein
MKEETMADEIVLRTEKLQKHFGSLHAVEEVTLEVRRGTVFGFLGPNGAGKTTTIGMILSLIRPTAGTVTVLGEPVTPSRNRVLRRVGSMAGAPALIPYLSARENLRLAARLNPGAADLGIDDALNQVGLADAADRAAGQFSTGMKQRLGLAVAMLHRPELLILDEPTNGMDPAGMLEVRNLLRKLADGGMTVFLSSHLLHEIEQVCDEVVILNRGKVVRQGRVSELLGKDQAVVKVRVPSPAEAATLLLTLPGVSAVKPNGSYVTVSGVTGEAVVRCLASHGIIPGEVANGNPDLEQVFLQLTNS